MFDLVYPLFAMALLTFAVMLTLFLTRVRSVVQGEVRAAYFKTYQGGEESRRAVQLSRHFTNLFETPVLFYVVCLAAMFSEQQSALLAGLAWTYVALRVAHALIHIGRNKLRPRMVAYMTSWVVLLSMWGVVLAGRV